MAWPARLVPIEYGALARKTLENQNVDSLLKKKSISHKSTSKRFRPSSDCTSVAGYLRAIDWRSSTKLKHPLPSLTNNTSYNDVM